MGRRRACWSGRRSNERRIPVFHELAVLGAEAIKRERLEPPARRDRILPPRSRSRAGATLTRTESRLELLDVADLVLFSPLHEDRVVLLVRRVGERQSIDAWRVKGDGRLPGCCAIAVVATAAASTHPASIVILMFMRSPERPAQGSGLSALPSSSLSPKP